MPSDYCSVVRSQFHSALAMLEQCIDRCPDEQWDEPIGVYPYWQVVYHTLCFVDCYLSASNEDFIALVASRQGKEFNPQPTGMAELEGEFPSRRFTREEMIRYAAWCRDKMESTLKTGADVALDGPSGFSWLQLSRAELHLYNLRHVQHHTGQLTAALRRVGVETAWVKGL